MTEPTALPFGRYLMAVGLVIVILFTILDPSASQGLGLGQRLLFWILHTYGALAILAWTQSRFDQWRFWRRQPWWATISAGLVGAILFAPLAFGLESLLGMVAEADGDTLDVWAEGWGFFGSLVVEAVELSLPVTLSWLAINLPWLLRLDFTMLNEEAPKPQLTPDGSIAHDAPNAGFLANDDAVVDQESLPVASSTLAEGPALEKTSPPALEPPMKPPVKETLATVLNASGLLSELPSALGRDLVALSSQLHYLEVRTSRGRMLMLYNLRDAIRELEGHIDGFQIHRSHWVADHHVSRLARRGKGWVCELSNGLELPISRRRVSEAKQRWGDSTNFLRVGSG